MATFSPLMSPLNQAQKQGLSWKQWLKGWALVISETFIQRIMAAHLPNPLPLPPLNGMNCIVTGSSSGIGLEIARQLAESGANVVMAVNNPSTAHELIQIWQENRSNFRQQILHIEVMELDLLSLKSVVKFSEKWNSSSKPLHILINNAGIFAMGKPQTFSENGHETHMQVNHFAPALLSILLLPSLKKGAPSRIINVNSITHSIGFIDATDMNFWTRKFTSLRAYSSSKLAQLMFSSVLQKRLPADSGINIVCVNPGSVRTNIVKDLPKIVQFIFSVTPYFFFSPQEGSRSAIYGATGCEIVEYCRKLKAEEWPVCAYLGCDCRLMDPSEEAHNVLRSDLVWEKTLEMVGLASHVVENFLEGKEIMCRYGYHLS